MLQRLRDAVKYIMSKNNYQVTNYIDDIIDFSTPTKATKSFEFLHKLLLGLDFKISVKKLVPPSTKVTCLGVEINTINFTVCVISEQIKEFIETCIKSTVVNYSLSLGNCYIFQSVYIPPGSS